MTQNAVSSPWVTIEMGVFVVPLAGSVRWESPSVGVAAAVPDKMNAVPGAYSASSEVSDASAAADGCSGDPSNTLTAMP